MMRKFGSGIVLGVVGTILLAIVVWATVVYTGAAFVSALPGLSAENYRAPIGSGQQHQQHSPSPAASDASAGAKAGTPA